MPISRKKWSNTSGMRYQRRAGVEAEAVVLPGAGAAADAVARSSTVTSQPSRASSAAEARPAMPPPMTTARSRRCSGASVVARCAAARREAASTRRRGERASALTGSGTRTRVAEELRGAACGGAGRRARRTGRARAATARRLGAGSSAIDRAGGGEVGVDVVEQRGLVGLGERAGSTPGEVAAAERVVVGGEVAQEVHLLERGAEAPGAARRARVAGGVVGAASPSTRNARRHISPTTSAEP